MNCNNITFSLLIGLVFILLFCYCNQRIDNLKNENFYEPKLKFNITQEPIISSN